MPKGKRGGRRQNAGRKAGTGQYGEGTEVMRVPRSSMQQVKRALIHSRDGSEAKPTVDDFLFYVELGRLLRKHREASNLSQMAVGDKLGISFQQVQKYESGINRIPVSQLMRWCRITFTQPATLMAQADKAATAPPERTSK